MTNPLPVDVLRWRCDATELGFETTNDVKPLVGVVGQDDAVEALRFGLETDAPGQNIFVRGLSGTGRMTLVKKLLADIRPSCALTRDHCYVHNFNHPDRPRLITLPAGKGQEFRRRVEKLASFIREHLGPALSSEGLKARRAAIEEAAEQEFRSVMEPFKKALNAAGLTLVSRQLGPLTETVIFPMVDGKPVPPEEFAQLIARGEASQEQQAELQRKQAEFEQQFADISEKSNEIRRKHDQAVQEVLEDNARALLGKFTTAIERDFPRPSVRQYMRETVDDVISNRLAGLGKEDNAEDSLYRVNVVLEHRQDSACPIIVENTPTMRKLLGTID